MKQVNNMRLKNTIMQLRKVCSHPFLFEWPIDPETRQSVLGEELVNASGKMMVLDRLLQELFKRKHKVLLFSQFTTMLNIIEVRAPLFILVCLFIMKCRSGQSITWAGISVGLMAPASPWNVERK